MTVSTLNANHRATVVSLLIDISVDADATDSLTVGPYKLGSVHIPSTFTSASIGFQTNDTGTWTDISLDGTDALISIAVTAGRSYALDTYAAVLSGFKTLRITTASAELADRTIWVTLKA